MWDPVFRGGGNFEGLFVSVVTSNATKKRLSRYVCLTSQRYKACMPWDVEQSDNRRFLSLVTAKGMIMLWPCIVTSADAKQMPTSKWKFTYSIAVTQARLPLILMTVLMKAVAEWTSWYQSLREKRGVSNGSLHPSSCTKLKDNGRGKKRWK